MISKTHNKTFLILLLFLAIILPQQTTAQETILVGQVVDKNDLSAIPEVNIFFKNTNIGSKSNNEGYFLLRTNEKVNVVVFSCVGYKQKEIRLKQGQSLGMQVELVEETNMLQEVFVIPGSNPALAMMRKIRVMKPINDLTRQPGFSLQRKGQSLVLLSKIKQGLASRKVFEKISRGAISNIDSSLTLPLYMSESYFIDNGKTKTEVSQNNFSTPESAQLIIRKLLGDIDVNLNFYDNAVTIFGKNMISPLSNTGNVYYDFYLADSTLIEKRKNYEVHFRTKNEKNLAFNGKMFIDSGTYALTGIDLALPRAANLNYLHNLKINQTFTPVDHNKWVVDQENTNLSLTYALLGDSLNPTPELFVKRSVQTVKSDSVIIGNFAQSTYTAEELDRKINDLGEAPIVKYAKWLADVIFTGYIPIGKFEIGKIQNLARITDLEGFRMTLPVYTNEKMWKNLRLGGSIGYGFGNQVIKYSGSAQVKIPSQQRRILSLSYNNDYRSDSYKYNDYLQREEPLTSGDEDIASTVFSFRSAKHMNDRREFNLSYATDWNNDIETSVQLRSNTLMNSDLLPFIRDGIQYNSAKQQSVTVLTRFSFNERVYDDFFQRIYITNFNPIIYAFVEGGQYEVGTKKGNYAKLSAMVRQRVNFNIGQWDYMVEGGLFLGDLPYQMLEMPSGNVTNGYSMYGFSLMNLMEYRADKYLTFHNEILLNGIILNQIPLIKHFNFRELFSLKMYYGTLSKTHSDVLDIPSYIHSTKIPYIEVGAGFSNILRLFTLQSFWRITENDTPNTVKWGLKGSIRISL